jgi:hypothetical protein
MNTQQQAKLVALAIEFTQVTDAARMFSTGSYGGNQLTQHARNRMQFAMSSRMRDIILNIETLSCSPE